MENRRSLVLRQVNASCRRWNFPMERVPGVECLCWRRVGDDAQYLTGNRKSVKTPAFPCVIGSRLCQGAIPGKLGGGQNARATVVRAFCPILLT